MASALPLALAVIVGLSFLPPQPPPPCREHPKLVGPCFRIRGRMNYWNGMPGMRIWRVGTRRMLGVVSVDGNDFTDADFNTLPDNIKADLSPDTDLFGDFVVCPFTPDKPGEMRMVCIDSATNLRARERESRERR
jgi:hypothetical protein